MIDLLMGDSSIILQDVIIDSAGGCDELLYNGQYFRKLIVGDVGELLAVMLRNHQSMATAQRLDVKEGKDLVALEELEGWDVPFDDLAEDTRSHFARRSH